MASFAGDADLAIASARLKRYLRVLTIPPGRRTSRLSGNSSGNPLSDREFCWASLS